MLRGERKVLTLAPAVLGLPAAVHILGGCLRRCGPHWSHELHMSPYALLNTSFTRISYQRIPWERMVTLQILSVSRAHAQPASESCTLCLISTRCDHFPARRWIPISVHQLGTDVFPGKAQSTPTLARTYHLLTRETQRRHRSQLLPPAAFRKPLGSNRALRLQNLAPAVRASAPPQLLVR